MSYDTTPWIIVLGDPVAQARIVTLFNVVFEHLGIRALAIPREALRIDALQVAACLSQGQVVGVCTTGPALVDPAVELGELSIEARQANAVSAVRRDPKALSGLQAGLLDGVGFVRHLEAQGFRCGGARVLINGAGAEGAALGFELARCGAARIDYRDWDYSRAEALSRRLEARGTLKSNAQPAATEAYDLIVLNSTVSSPHQVGNSDAFRADMWVADTCLWSESSPMLHRAAQAGARTFTGIPFLRDQVRLYLSFFAPVLLESGHPAAEFLAPRTAS